MYYYVNCKELEDEVIYEAFQAGFIDYMIQIEMTVEQFVHHFFNQEGNERELSFVAFNDEKPVGVILGGVKENETFKTLRCGAMSVIPEERGTGVAQALMRLHKTQAKELGFKQLFLEVIASNERGNGFYKKEGYETVGNIYYKKWDLKNTKLTMNTEFDVKEVDYDELKALRALDQSHLPWQGSFEYFKKLPCKYYCVYSDDELIGGLALTDKSLFYGWVKPTFRRKGAFSLMIMKAMETMEIKELRVSYTNNPLLHSFTKKFKMTTDPISQNEMYLWLE